MANNPGRAADRYIRDRQVEINRQIDSLARGAGVSRTVMVNALLRSLGGDDDQVEVDDDPVTTRVSFAADLDIEADSQSDLDQRVNDAVDAAVSFGFTNIEVSGDEFED